MMRGAAALGVIVWHTIGWKGDVPELLNVPGRVSVWIFFGVSGYVIAHGWFASERYTLEPRSILQFYINRALRICPLFFLITAIAVAYSWLEGNGLLIGIADVPSQVFAFQWNHNYVVNGVFWTLGIELQFYAIFPICVFLLSMFSDSVRPVLITSAWLCLWLVPAVMRLYAPGDPTSVLDSRNLAGNLQHFLAGALVAALIRAQVLARLSNMAGALGTLVFGLAGLVAATLMYHEHRSGFWFLKGSLVVDGAIVSLLLCHVIVERMDPRRYRGERCDGGRCHRVWALCVARLSDDGVAFGHQ
jgi:peptidoglycan/LPS O-acetylase OafA/YrhL